MRVTVSEILPQTSWLHPEEPSSASHRTWNGPAYIVGEIRLLLSDTQGSLVLEGEAPSLPIISHSAKPWRAGGHELRLIRNHVFEKVSADQDLDPVDGSLAATLRPVLRLLDSPTTLPAPIADHPVKRWLDVTGAAALLFLLLPLLFCVGLCVLLDRRGPVLFLQRRCGLNGGVFRICKFRTMVVGDDSDSVEQTRKGDQRITLLGAFLRRTSIDEFPQLLNVLAGHMSLVGPRPHAASHDRDFAQRLPDYARRYRVRPGITGLAQVRGLRGAMRTPDQLAARLASDLEYIERWSLAADLRILVASVGVVFRSDGA